MDTVFADFSMNKRCHIPVKRSHKLIRRFHERYIYSELTQIFRNLYSDKATADNNCRFRMMLIRIFLESKRILNGAQGKYLIAVNTVKPRFYRLSTGREHELVITLGKDFTVFKIFYGNGFAVRMNCRSFMMNIHLNSKTPPKAFRRLQG